MAATLAPASAYGKANWQVTFAGTGTIPGQGGFGFWGWCDYAGGVSAGNTGDCQFAEYLHAPGGSGFTCHESLDISSWAAETDFIVSGTVTVTPTQLTAPCLAFFPGSSPFENIDSGLPAAAGHYNLGVSNLPGGVPPGTVGEYNVTVTQVP